jgi:hypothetical protein
MDERLNLQLLEHRRFPRYPCRGAAEILQSGRHSGQGTVSKISRGGCYIETARPLPLGTEVQLRLTVADIGLYIGAKVACTDLVGMGMDFMVVPPEQGNKLAQTIEKVTGTDFLPAVMQAERGEPNTVFRITQKAAPDILAEIIKRINEKGVLTRQELLDIVKANR